MIDQPYIGERFWGGFGQARMTGPQGARDLKTRGEGRLSEAILCTTFPEVGSVVEGAAFREVSKVCRLTRYGLDCYAYALLAAGHIDLVIEAGLSNYDIQAPIGVIEAAGGIVTGLAGSPGAARRAGHRGGGTGATCGGAGDSGPGDRRRLMIRGGPETGGDLRAPPGCCPAAGSGAGRLRGKCERGARWILTGC